MTTSAYDPGDQLAAARAYVAAGLSVIPVRADGSKAPALDGWREFTDRRPTDEELRGWFSAAGRYGIGVPGGPASGNLAVLDFEVWNVFVGWGGRLSDDERYHLARCPVIRTPGDGAHVWCRLTGPVAGCKLARTASGRCLIEVRGRGHMVVAPGSPPACHPTGRPYRLARSGWLDGGPFEQLPLDVYHALTVHAAELTEYRRPAPRRIVGDRPSGAATGDRPGDDFNARVGWSEILEPRGWRVYQTTAAATYWCRPGKSPAGVSASTGFCRGPSGGDLLYVFSTSAPPFEAETTYGRFGAYATLYHHGDFAAASRALRQAGYGKGVRV